MRRIIVILFISFNVYCFSQQDPQIALSVLNKSVTNPAYLVENNYINLYTFYRQQWMGVEKAPNTIFGGVSVPLHNYNSTVGVKFMYDKLGFETKTQFSLTGAYFRKINEGKDGAISIGTELGVYQDAIDGTLTLPDGSTKLTDFVAAKSFDASLGIAYFCKYYHVGFSVYHITSPKLSVKYDGGSMTLTLARHYYLSAGTEQEVAKNLILKPYFKMKSDIGAWQYEISTVAEYNNSISGGLEYRDDALGLIFGLNTSWGVKLYGCYEISSADIVKSNGNSIEFFITYDFNVKSKFNKKIKINRFL